MPTSPMLLIMLLRVVDLAINVINLIFGYRYFYGAKNYRNVDLSLNENQPSSGETPII